MAAPIGIKDIEYDVTMSKEAYIEIGFREVKIGTTPQQTYYLANNIQAQQKQYGFKHRVTSTIHAAMGDTLPIMVSQISGNDSNSKIWDKRQMVAFLSRKKCATNTIFLRQKIVQLQL